MERRMHNFSGLSDFKLIQLAEAWFLSRGKSDEGFEKFLECQKQMREDGEIFFDNYDNVVPSDIIESSVEAAVHEFIEDYLLKHPEDKHIDVIDELLHEQLLKVVSGKLAARMEASDEKYIEFLEGTEIRTEGK